MTPEGRIKAMVKRDLAKLQRLYKFMPVQNGMGAPSLDFILCAGGWYIAVETKAPGKTPTPRQETTIAAIEAAHGLVFVVDGPTTWAKALAAITSCCKLADLIREPKGEHNGHPVQAQA